MKMNQVSFPLFSTYFNNKSLESVAIFEFDAIVGSKKYSILVHPFLFSNIISYFRTSFPVPENC